MNIIVNGEEQMLASPSNIDELLTLQGYGDMMVAVARNGTFVPRSEYMNTNIEDGDQIEIVAPMQGG